MHIAVLLVLVLLVFGAKRLPEIGQSLGGGLRGFRQSLTDEGTPAGLGAGQPTEAALPQHAASLAGGDAQAPLPLNTALSERETVGR